MKTKKQNIVLKVFKVFVVSCQSYLWHFLGQEEETNLRKLIPSFLIPTCMTSDIYYALVSMTLRA